MKKSYLSAFADEASPFIDSQIAAMKRNGLNGLEIRNVDEVNVSDISLEKAREVRRKLDDAGLITWSVGSPIGKIGIEDPDFNAHLDKLKHTIEIARILGTENIRMFSFYIPQGRNPEDFRGQVLDRLSMMAQTAAGTGVELCHENEKCIYGDNASRCLDILTQIPQIRGIFDPANFVQCGQDTDLAWKMLSPYIKYMHIKDAGKDDGMVVPAGWGDGHVREIVSDYLACGGINCTIEPHLKEFGGLDGLEQEESRSNVGQIRFRTQDEAFDFACTTFKNLMHWEKV